jgi:hypothetical protein
MVPQEYRMIWSTLVEVLERRVTQALKEEWELYGPPIILNENGGGGTIYYQAVVK